MSEVSIKVYCRFRPLIENEKKNSTEISYSLIDDKRVKMNTSEKIFEFERVFGENVTQEEIFKATTEPIVKSVFEGFNGTIIAYGQTSSGKTFTMTGGGGELMGIIPRITKNIFELVEIIGGDIGISVQYIEIYNEKLIDLTNPNREQYIDIYENNKKLYIKGASSYSVSDEKDVMKYIKIGNDNRSVASTNLNKRSSRSHSVFIFNISRGTPDSNVKTEGKLLLVDLAGSESSKKTNAKGKTLIEANNINISLLTLGNVISKLINSGQTADFRSSKLTRLLKDSLGGNSMTSFIINCSPSTSNNQETIHTLEFGLKAIRVKNQLKRNEIKTDESLKYAIAEKDEIIFDLKNQIESLKKHSHEDIIYDLNPPPINDAKVQEYEQRISSLHETLQNEKNKLQEKDDYISSLNNKIQELMSEKDALFIEKQDLSKENETLKMKLDILKDIDIERNEKIKKKKTQYREEKKNEFDNLKILLDIEIKRLNAENSDLKQQINKKFKIIPQRSIALNFLSCKAEVTNENQLNNLKEQIYERTQELKAAEIEKKQNISKYEYKIFLKNSEDRPLLALNKKIMEKKAEMYEKFESILSENLKISDISATEKLAKEYFQSKLDTEIEIIRTEKLEMENQKNEIIKKLNARIEELETEESRNFDDPDSSKSALENENFELREKECVLKVNNDMLIIELNEYQKSLDKIKKHKDELNKRNIELINEVGKLEKDRENYIKNWKYINIKKTIVVEGRDVSYSQSMNFGPRKNDGTQE